MLNERTDFLVAVATTLPSPSASESTAYVLCRTQFNLSASVISWKLSYFQASVHLSAADMCPASIARMCYSWGYRSIHEVHFTVLVEKKAEIVMHVPKKTVYIWNTPLCFCWGRDRWWCNHNAHLTWSHPRAILWDGQILQSVDSARIDSGLRFCLEAVRLLKELVWTSGIAIKDSIKYSSPSTMTSYPAVIPSSPSARCWGNTWAYSQQTFQPLESHHSSSRHCKKNEQDSLFGSVTFCDVEMLPFCHPTCFAAFWLDSSSELSVWAGNFGQDSTGSDFRPHGWDRSGLSESHCRRCYQRHRAHRPPANPARGWIVAPSWGWKAPLLRRWLEMVPTQWTKNSYVFSQEVVWMESKLTLQFLVWKESGNIISVCWFCQNTFFLFSVNLFSLGFQPISAVQTKEITLMILVHNYSWPGCNRLAELLRQLIMSQAQVE